MTVEERIAVLETQQINLNIAFSRMEKKIDDLTEAANKGKGAVAVLIGVGSIFGGLVSWLLTHINFH